MTTKESGRLTKNSLVNHLHIIEHIVRGQPFSTQLLVLGNNLHVIGGVVNFVVVAAAVCISVVIVIVVTSLLPRYYLASTKLRKEVYY